MNEPSRAEAENFLEEARRINPGPWVQHSRYAAQAAEALAFGHPEIDPETAFIFGLLHDIGRINGVHGMRHGLDGYRYLQSHGYQGAARISLTHSYPTKKAVEGASDWDGTTEEFAFVQEYLQKIEYTAYDRLIQLCDCIAQPSGFCIMEVRLVDVVMRYGFNRHTLKRWRAYLGIKTEFEQVLGRSIYAGLPGLVDNIV
jgi:hypothetical protein